MRWTCFNGGEEYLSVLQGLNDINALTRISQGVGDGGEITVKGLVEGAPLRVETLSLLARCRGVGSLARGSTRARTSSRGTSAVGLRWSVWRRRLTKEEFRWRRARPRRRARAIGLGNNSGDRLRDRIVVVGLRVVSAGANTSGRLAHLAVFSKGGRVGGNQRGTRGPKWTHSWIRGSIMRTETGVCTRNKRAVGVRGRV